MKNPFSRRHHQAAPAAPEKPQKGTCTHSPEEDNKGDKGDIDGSPAVAAAVQPRAVQKPPGDTNNDKREDAAAAQEINDTAQPGCEVNCAHQDQCHKAAHDQHKCDSAPAAKPHLFSLCTKCANDGKESTQRSRREPPKGFITRSESYINASAASRWEIDACCGDEASPVKDPSAPVFDRSRFVQEVQLDGGVSIHDFFDFPHGQHLGKGSYGSVVKGRDLKTGVMRAIKIVFKPRIENVTRLKREILIMKRLDHPNIIKLFEVYEDDKNLYLVMELCTGGELFERIIKAGHFSELNAALIMRQIFSAAAYCHSNNVMHRDLKPENLLFCDSTTPSTLKVIDGKDNQAILKRVQSGEFTFDPRHWKDVSDQAKDLVRRCLTYVPSKRITAQAALQHPWIQLYASGRGVERPLSLRLGSDLIERFKSFQRLHKLKRLAITCVAYQLSDGEIGMLHSAFAALDKNADGVLTVNEIQQGLEQCGIHGDDVTEVLKELDTDGNGKIDYTEFIAASLDQRIYEQESACQNAFRVFDLDRDGKISVDELQKVLETNYIEDTFTKEAVVEMVKECDLNNDGMIDFDEFMRMMRTRQRKASEASSRLARARAILYNFR